MKNTPAILALLAPIFMFVVSVLMIVVVGFNVTSQMDASPVPLYLNPAGYAFIIWQFIYIGFIALGFYQYRKEFRYEVRFVKARKYIIINCLCNAVWFYGVISNQLWITVICMVLLLVTLINLSILFELGKPSRDRKERFFLKLPLALYFGWITLATPINITSFLLTDLGWTGQESFGPQVWSVIILIIAFGIIVSMYLSQRANTAYLLVGVWGLTAIYVANRDMSELVSLVAVTLATGLLVIWAVKTFYLRSKMTNTST